MIVILYICTVHVPTTWNGFCTPVYWAFNQMLETTIWEKEQLKLERQRGGLQDVRV